MSINAKQEKYVCKVVEIVKCYWQNRFIIRIFMKTKKKIKLIPFLYKISNAERRLYVILVIKNLHFSYLIQFGI